MRGSVDDLRQELEDLLQFFYQCPVGLIETDDGGTVRQINPAAARMLAPVLFSPVRTDSGPGPDTTLTELFPLLRRLAPAVIDAVVTDRQRLGPLVSGERMVIPAGPDGEACLEAIAVRVDRDRVMLALVDVSEERRLARRERELGDELHQAIMGRLHMLVGLQEGVTAMAAASTPDDVLRATVGPGLAGLGARAGFVAARAADGGFDVLDSAGYAPDAVPTWPHDPDGAKSPMTDAVLTHTPVLLTDLAQARQRYPRVAAHLEAGDDRSWAAVPFPRTAPIEGGIFLSFAEAQPFGPDQVAMLSTLAQVAGQALARATAHAREQRARRRAELLARVSTCLDAADLTPQTRRQALVDLVVPDLADFATLEAPGPDGRPTQLALAHADPTRLALLRDVRHDALIGPGHPPGTPRLVDLDADGPDVEPGPGSLRGLGARSALIVPLRARGRVIAAMMLGQVGSGRRFGADDLALAAEIADRGAVMIDNAGLFEREHQLAVELQTAMLPRIAVDVPGVELAVRYRPAEQHLMVGGDWYDAFPLSSGRIGLVIGDVVGHSLTAATVMGQLRSAAAALADGAADPGELLTRLERFAERLPAMTLCTLAYLDLDPATGMLRYANAGHPPPMILDPDRTVRPLAGALSLPLGVIGGEVRPHGVVQLAAGCTVLLYTDGLVERRHEHLDEGFSRLERALIRRAGLGSEPLSDALLADLLADRAAHDDVALVCLTYRAVDAAPAVPVAQPARHDDRCPPSGCGAGRA
jgi:serine phosphatase RsbU (regulator of sigma subunit)